jgi:hypothetical protein
VDVVDDVGREDLAHAEHVAPVRLLAHYSTIFRSEGSRLS